MQMIDDECAADERIGRILLERPFHVDDQDPSAVGMVPESGIEVAARTESELVVVAGQGIFRPRFAWASEEFETTRQGKMCIGPGRVRSNRVPVFCQSCRIVAAQGVRAPAFHRSGELCATHFRDCSGKVRNERGSVSKI